MAIGYVQIHRSYLDWEWYQAPVVSRLFLHLILKVNFKDKKWQGLVVKRGQLITSYGHLAAELGVGVQSVRTSLDKLAKSGCIRIDTTNRFTLITLLNYDDYQAGTSKSNIQIDQRTIKQEASAQHSSNNPLTTTKESNNDNNKKIEERKEIFRKQVFSHSNYKNEILIGFFDHWSELDKHKVKMRFENEDYFEVNKRLKKWNKNERVNFNKNSKTKELLTNR